MDVTSVLASMGREDFGGFWQRTAAVLIDTLLLLIPVELLSLWLRGEFLGTYDPDAAGAQLYEGVAIAAIHLPYTVLLWSSSWQATIGKRICGLRVVDEMGRRIGVGRATARALALIVSGNILIGVLMVPFTSKRQGLHDMIARTYVVKGKALVGRSNNALEQNARPIASVR